jgi:integrase
MRHVATALPLSDPVTAFEEHLARVGRAPATRTKYLQALRILESRLGGARLLNLSASEIDSALALWEAESSRERGRPLSRAAARGRVCALRAFFAWAEKLDLLVSNGNPHSNPMTQIVTPVVPQRPNDRLQPREDVALLSEPQTAEERVIVWLLRWTGLRVSEAVQLRVGDVELASGREAVHVRRSKTYAGTRVIPVVPELVAELESWLAYLATTGRGGADTPLLATSRCTPMKTTYIWRVVKRVAARAGVRVTPCTCGSSTAYRHNRGCPQTTSGENVSAVSPHTLRRTFATDLLNRGVRLEVVSKLLGHSSVAITQKAYATLLDSTARRELLTALGHEST